MSLRPGIGLGMCDELASVLLDEQYRERMIDVPLQLQHGGVRWPLGRYLRRKLREKLGRHPNAPESVLQAQSAELQVLRETAWTSETSVKSTILKASLGRRRQLEARERRKYKRETI